MNDDTREALQDLEKRCADCNLREIIWLALDDYDRAEVIASILRTHDRAAAYIAEAIDAPPLVWKDEEDATPDFKELSRLAYLDTLAQAEEDFEDMKATIMHTQEALTILQATEAEKAAAIQTNKQREAQPKPPPLTNAEQQEVLAHFLQSDNAELREMASDCIAILAMNEEGTRH